MKSVRSQLRCVRCTHAPATSSDDRHYHVYISSTPCALTDVSAGHPPWFKTSSDRSRPTLADVHLSCIQLLHLKSTDRSEQEPLWYLLQTLCDGLKLGLDYSHVRVCLPFLVSYVIYALGLRPRVMYLRRTNAWLAPVAGLAHDPVLRPRLYTSSLTLWSRPVTADSEQSASLAFNMSRRIFSFGTET